MELVDAREEDLQAGEGCDDRRLVGEERRERGGELCFFRLERGERGEDLRKRRQRRGGRARGLCG
jgi:hypothetical protein